MICDKCGKEFIEGFCACDGDKYPGNITTNDGVANGNNLSGAVIRKCSLWEILKSLHSFKGRITPKSSWKVFILTWALFFFILLGSSYLVNSGAYEKGGNIGFLGLAVIASYLPFLYLMYCSFVTMVVQRLHDLGISGYWWWLSILINMLNYFSILVKWESEPNRLAELQRLNIPLDGFFCFIVYLTIFTYYGVFYSITGNDKANAYGSERI